jgi:hypothetical protein
VQGPRRSDEPNGDCGEGLRIGRIDAEQQTGEHAGDAACREQAEAEVEQDRRDALDDEHSQHIHDACAERNTYADLPRVVRLRAPSLNGSGFRNTASAMLNTTVLAPMPSASVATIIAVNPGRRCSSRSA